MSAETLKEAYQLIREGNRAEAIALLTPLLKSDKDNKNAWWLLANAASKPEQVEYALKNVLRLDPYHSQAQAKLDKLQADSATDFFSTVTDDQPSLFETSTLSYFSSSSDETSASQNTAWGTIDKSSLSNYTIHPSVGSNTSAAYPYPGKQNISSGMSNSTFWTIFGVMILAGVCIFGGIAYAAGVFDSFLGILPDAPPPQEGWSSYNGNEMTIQLPSEWVTFDVASNSDLLIDSIADTFPDFEDQIDLVRNDPDLYRFLATDPNHSTRNALTNVVITTENIGIFMSIDRYMNLSIENLPSEFSIQSQTVREIEPFGDVGVIESNFSMFGSNAHQIYYLIKTGSQAWVIVYTCDAALFESLRADFEHSLTTFRPD